MEDTLRSATSYMPCTARRPRLFLYDASIGIPPWGMTHDARLYFLFDRIRRSSHFTPNGDCADFFLIHNYVSTRGMSSARVLALFDRIAAEYPHWNRTANLGLRHFLVSPCDHGAGDCMYDRMEHPANYLDDRPHGIVKWRDIDIRATTRRVGLLTLNGHEGGATNFRRSMDIRLPSFDNHECGPYCGVPSHHGQHQRTIARRILRHYSPWSETQPRRLRARRRWRLFFAGRATLGGARGDLFKHHSQRQSFLIHDTSGRHPPSIHHNKINVTKKSFFAEGMSSSDFCFVPLGQSDGDSDRYLPALLYGCVPVFASGKAEAKPFEEVIRWEDFSLDLPGGPAQVKGLHQFLSKVDDTRLYAMRRAMAAVWPKMLWTSVSGSTYLGEPKSSDAFATLIAVLAKRLGINVEVPGRRHAS